MNNTGNQKSNVMKDPCSPQIEKEKKKGGTKCYQ